ncbi:putative oligomeric Golgi complex subunit [Suhomyces tanzawaensis NRRL Y-17324]|uniref:Conserved oligomeric Golgi complex subunit 5 n=1 Tax=Suhomyces tanzawaensis NRRL Y-17324 TaxID=984487 RepID=A0A1E4SBL5_9ASCO|nr:putative oligomeric Golgi complex subunit [Suhomyces tanzawaensis NRRL Y-17324]ODV76875.1 putative oligomeric Golgi complex subunit [Suhomyces tanzawaensis NRRL Y-17324]
MTTIKNELEDFEAFLEADFQDSVFARDLLLATNGSDGPELDLSTPIKKLQFDIQECEKRMKAIAASNYEALVQNFSKIEGSKELLDGKINSGIKHINSSFDRIKTGVIQPYDEAVRLNNALKRIHVTLDLLRSSSYFIFLLQQLEELDKADSNMVRLARLMVQIHEFYVKEERGATRGASLLRIRLIRDSRADIENKRLELRSRCVHAIQAVHNSNFSPDNQDLHNGLVSLYILDKKDFLSVLEKATVNRLVDSSLTQLSRSLQSPRNFTAIVSDVKHSSQEYFDKLAITLNNCEVPNENLFNSVLEHWGGNALTESFWIKLTSKFKKNIAATMARGGPIAKNLRVYYPGIKNSLVDTFNVESERNLVLDAVSIIPTE